MKTRVTLILASLLLPHVCAAEDLAQIFTLAESQDPQFRSVQAAYRATLEQRPQARAQLMLPTLSFNTNTAYNRQDTELGGDSGVGSGGLTEFHSWGWGLQLNQPIYHHDRFVALKQADEAIRQAELDVDAARQDLIVRSGERYFDMLAAIDTLEFARAEKDALGRQLEQTTQRFEVGLIAITGVQEAKAGYDLATADEILARNLLDNTVEALREITGEYHRNLSLLGDKLPLVAPEPQDIDLWTETALQQNLRLAAALVATQSAENEIRRQYAGHVPTLDIVGSHGFGRQGGRFGNVEQTTTALGLELNVPIYEGGQVVSRTREAQERYHEILEVLEQQRRTTVRQTRDSYLGVISGISRVKALNQAVVSTQTALEATEAGFEVGTRTSVDVVSASRDLFRAKRDYARARYDYILDILRLKQAAGTLSPDDVNEINAWLN